jgi:hypothetical protein
MIPQLNDSLKLYGTLLSIGSLCLFGALPLIGSLKLCGTLLSIGCVDWLAWYAHEAWASSTCLVLSSYVAHSASLVLSCRLVIDWLKGRKRDTELGVGKLPTNLCTGDWL